MATDRRKWWYYVWPFLAVIAVIVFWILITGCATADEMAGLKAQFEDLRIQLVGDVQVGGQGDTVTSWILAVGLVGAVLYYPIVHRPARRWLERRKAKNGGK